MGVGADPPAAMTDLPPLANPQRWVLGIFLLVCALGVACFRWTSRRTKGEPAAPAAFQSSLLPLLFPTVALVILAAVVLVRDWQSAQHDATVRAQDVAERVASHLAGALSQDVLLSPSARNASQPLNLHSWQIDAYNDLVTPAPGSWPPTPQPLALRLLPDHARDVWDAAHAALTARAWTHALSQFDALLTEPALSNFRSDQPSAIARLRLLAMFGRALALEQGEPQASTAEPFLRLFDEATLTPNLLGESGLPVCQLVALHWLDAGERRTTAPPPDANRRTGPLAWIVARSAETPYVERILERLERAAGPQRRGWVVGAPDGFIPLLEAARLSRTLHRNAREQLPEEQPWPKAFWIDHPSPGWLAAEQYFSAPNARGEPSDSTRTFALIETSWLQRELEVSAASADRAEDFVVTLQVAGRQLIDHRHRSGPAVNEPAPELATVIRAPASLINVSASVGLRDPVAFFAAHRQRTLVFGALLGLVIAATFWSAWTTRQALRQQHALNTQKSNFVSSVSHELRAPLGSLRLLAEGLERGTVADEARRQEYFRLIGQESRRLGALVENILDFSRIEQGRKRYEFEPTDLVALVKTTAQIFEPLAADRHVRLELQLAAEAANWAVQLDGRALQQALLNLLDNALKHSPSGTGIHVRLEPQTTVATAPPASTPSTLTEFRLSVRDEGPGIPPSEHARIFEPFYRRGSELRRETQGIGIGLSIVRHIVDAHGGRIDVDSDLGRGATFTLILPLTSPPALPCPES